MTAALLSNATPPLVDLPAPLARVLAAASDGLAPVPAQRVPVGEAEGGVLAAPLVVPSPVPAEAVALRRGYAVVAADTLGAGPYSPVPLRGRPILVEPGQTLPDGADAVLPEDAVLLAGGRAEAQESAAPGMWARRIGEDAPAEAVLSQAGEVLSTIDLAVAEAAGIPTCEIRRVRVWWAEADSAPARLVRSLARSAGATDADSLEDANLVFAVGDTAGLLESFLGEHAYCLARRLALRPGEDGAVLRLGDVPVLLAPDRIADALGLWLGLGLPIVRALAGASPHWTEERPVSRKISSTVGLSEIALLRSTGRRFEPLGIGDLPLTAIASADAWAIVPPDSEGLAVGEAIEVELFGP